MSPHIPACLVPSMHRPLNSRPVRRIALLYRLGRRLYRPTALRAASFGGWVWLAAGSAIGFEAFDILFGTFALAPELLPFAVLGIALAWYFRGRLRRLLARTRAYRRLRRLRGEARRDQTTSSWVRRRLKPSRIRDLIVGSGTASFSATSRYVRLPK